jgi:hypothetical protein
VSWPGCGIAPGFDLDTRTAFDVPLFYYPHAATADMGGTRFLPGNHLRHVNEPWHEDDTGASNTSIAFSTGATCSGMSGADAHDWSTRVENEQCPLRAVGSNPRRC